MILAFFSIILLLLVWSQGFRIVPQEQVWVVERLGKYTRQLVAGLNWTFPLMDRVANRVSLKEEVIDVPEQTAVTQDNVSVIVDGIVYVKVTDPAAATYGVKDPIQALTQLVQTTMRSEIGKIPLDKTFEERESINGKIVEAINEAAETWGVKCLRYEIKDIKMPEDVRKAMELQMTAERQKRAEILKSEGLRQAKINESEGAQIDRVNRAKGEAEAITSLAMATAEGIRLVGGSFSSEGAMEAVSLQVAEKYIEAFRMLAKEGNTVLLPSNLQNPGSMVVEAVTLYDTLKRKIPSIPQAEVQK